MKVQSYAPIQDLVYAFHKDKCGTQQGALYFAMATVI